MEIGDIVVKVGMDSRPFERGMQRTRKEMASAKDLQSAIRDQFDLDSAANDFERNLVRMGQKFRDMLKQIRSAKMSDAMRSELIEKATSSYQRQVAVMEGLQKKQSQVSTLIVGETVAMSGRMKGALTQASFAVDDFFGVWQNSGNVGAAIRATSNNIGTLVTMMNPMAGIATTVALAFGSSLANSFFSAGGAAKSMADLVSEAGDRVASVLDKVQERFDKFREKRDRVFDIRFGGGDLDGARRESQDRVRVRRNQIAAINSELATSSAQDASQMSPEEFQAKQQYQKQLLRNRDRLLKEIEEEGKYQAEIAKEARERAEQERDIRKLKEFDKKLAEDAKAEEQERERQEKSRRETLKANEAFFKSSGGSKDIATWMPEAGQPQRANGPQFGGHFQAGSSEAFSEILRASSVAADMKKEEKEIAKTNKEIASYTKAVADAMRVADSLLLVPSLGGL